MKAGKWGGVFPEYLVVHRRQPCIECSTVLSTLIDSDSARFLVEHLSQTCWGLNFRPCTYNACALPLNHDFSVVKVR